jgi:hypothetical protein
LPPDPSAALDEATRALYERVCSEFSNRALLQALDDPASDEIRIGEGLQVVLVPGILYRQYPRTGADGAVLRQIAEHLGIPFRTIPLNGTEGLQSAADLITEHLAALPPDAGVLLFSLSKGSAEVRHALVRDPENPAFRRVRAWVSVSGLPFGTPSAELILSRTIPRFIFSIWCRLRRWNLEAMRELLLHRPAAAFELPAHMRFVQVAAFPREADLHDRRSRGLRKRLARFGPNDGFAVLSELTALPGHFYPLWGADHYLRGVPDLSQRITRLIRLLGAE